MKLFKFIVGCLSLVAWFALAAQGQTKAELFVQTGHNEEIKALAYSPDGKLLASGSDDETVKLWDVQTGTALATFLGHEQFIYSVKFSPDGKLIASASYDRTIKLWSVETGKEIRTINEEGMVNEIAFSPDGKLIAGFDLDGGESNKIIIWNVATGKQLRSLPTALSDYTALAFSPNGTMLASGDANGTIAIWNVASGRKLRALKGKASAVKVLKFGADGKTLTSGNADETLIDWDAASGRQLRTTAGSGGEKSVVALSPNGEQSASGGGEGNSMVTMRKTRTDSEIQKIQTGEEEIFAATFSPDGKTLAVGGKTIVFWDVETGSETRKLTDYSSGVSVLALSADGKTLASGGYNNKINLFDLTSGNIRRTLVGHSQNIKKLAFSSDGAILASTSDDDTIKIWDTASGREIKTLTDEAGIIFSVAFSPDAKLLASVGSEDVKLWSGESGQLLQSLTNPPVGMTGIEFSPDGKTLAMIQVANVSLWDMATGNRLHTLVEHPYPIDSIAFSADGKTLATGSRDGQENTVLKLHSVETGAVTSEFKGENLPIPEIVQRAVPAFKVSYENLVGPNNRWKIEESEVDFFGQITILDAKINQVLMTLMTMGDDDWFAYTPDGFFDGTPNGWRQAIWRLNGNTLDFVPVEAFFNDFYYPNLLADIFNDRKPKATIDISRKDIRQPTIKIVAPDADLKTNTVAERKVTLRIEIADAPPDKRRPTAGSGARDVRLFRNGSLVKLWSGDVLAGKSAVVLTADVPLVAGDNNFTAYAFNDNNVKSNDAARQIKGAESLKRAGMLYVLAIGVNSYANADYNLLYAVADVEAVAASIEKQQNALGKYPKTEIIKLTDKEATKANIIAALQRFADDKIAVPENAPANIKKIKTIQPEDALIVYYAGHGTASKDRFYLIPHDGFPIEAAKSEAAGLERLYAASVSDKDLETALEPIDAGKILIVIDACNSGQALESEEKRRGPMNSRGLAQLAYEKGVYILTAAQSKQSALEVSKLGHGLLTFALLEGLKKADENNSRDITEREWLDFAVRQVPLLQVEAIQERNAALKKTATVQKRSELSGAVNADANLPESRGLQVPRVFYRRELETVPLVIAKP